MSRLLRHYALFGLYLVAGAGALLLASQAGSTAAQLTLVGIGAVLGATAVGHALIAVGEMP